MGLGSAQVTLRCVLPYLDTVPVCQAWQQLQRLSAREAPGTGSGRPWRCLGHAARSLETTLWATAMTPCTVPP